MRYEDRWLLVWPRTIPCPAWKEVIVQVKDPAGCFEPPSNPLHHDVPADSLAFRTTLLQFLIHNLCAQHKSMHCSTGELTLISASLFFESEIKGYM